MHFGYIFIIFLILYITDIYNHSKINPPCVDSHAGGVTCFYLLFNKLNLSLIAAVNPTARGIFNIGGDIVIIPAL